MTADPRPARRIRDTDLMRLMHSERTKECAITGATLDLEIHHILPRGQGGDDVRANLVFLTRDTHRRITANDPVTRKLLGEHIYKERLDTLAYLTMKFGVIGAREWMRRRLLIGDNG